MTDPNSSFDYNEHQIRINEMFSRRVGEEIEEEEHYGEDDLEIVFGRNIEDDDNSGN